MECAPLSSAALLTNREHIAFFRKDWGDLRKESITLTLLSMQWRVIDQWNLRSRNLLLLRCKCVLMKPFIAAL